MHERIYPHCLTAVTQGVPEEEMLEQLSRLMASKGWPEPIDDLVDSVKDREKTVAGSVRAAERARKAESELEEWNCLSARDMWLRDMDSFASKL